MSQTNCSCIEIYKLSRAPEPANKTPFSAPKQTYLSHCLGRRASSSTDCLSQRLGEGGCVARGLKRGASTKNRGVSQQTRESVHHNNNSFAASVWRFMFNLVLAGISVKDDVPIESSRTLVCKSSWQNPCLVILG